MVFATFVFFWLGLLVILRKKSDVGGPTLRFVLGRHQIFLRKMTRSPSQKKTNVAINPSKNNLSLWLWLAGGG